jgi:Ni2+-binding GTPase involved in maturation of urease and hydrogenase
MRGIKGLTEQLLVMKKDIAPWRGLEHQKEDAEIVMNNKECILVNSANSNAMSMLLHSILTLHRHELSAFT